MYYGAIKKNDIADGPGVRVSLFVSGCRHHCKGCFQPQTWDFCFGRPYTKETQKEILDAMAPFYVKGLTVLGGEPFEPENQKDVAELISAVKKLYPEKDIWCYSGYLYDVDMVKGGKVYTEYTDTILSQTDVLVDGEFVLELKNLILKFRGSSNQRLIDVKKSTPENVVLWDK